MEGSFKPTLRMAAAARRGLRLREQFGRGGTDVGVARARQLVAGTSLDFADLTSSHSYFAHHEVDKETHTHRWDNDDDPSA